MGMRRIQKMRVGLYLWHHHGVIVPSECLKMELGVGLHGGLTEQSGGGLHDLLAQKIDLGCFIGLFGLDREQAFTKCPMIIARRIEFGGYYMSPVGGEVC